MIQIHTYARRTAALLPAAIVQICRTNRALVVDIPGADGGQAGGVFYDMVFGENKYSLRDIANTMRGLGAEARTA